MLLATLVAQQSLNNGITSDGALYFAHLRSVVFDGDLDIGPEIAALGQPPRPHHVVPIGPAIVWAPAYLLVAAGDWIGAAAGMWTRPAGVAVGLGWWYILAALLSSWLAMAAGLVALYFRLRREFGGAIALLTCALTLGATTLAWYVIYEPSMTHAVSFGVVAAALILTERWFVDRPPSWRHAIVLGMCFSLVIVVRPEDGVYLVFPLAALLFAPAFRDAPVRARLRLVGATLIGAAPLILVQAVLAARLLAGSSLTLIGGGDGYLTFFDARWADVLFSSRHGLVSWTPIVWVALIGIVGYVGRRPLWAIPAIVAFVALVWTNASAHDWSGGWAFGGRRFTSVLAALAPGVAVVLFWVRRHPLMLLGPAAALFIAWNLLLMTQYQRQMLPRDEAVRFDVLVRQQADLVLKSPFMYPFAFPANALFAWREGLPIDRYDLLGPEPLRREMYLPLNDWGERFLLDGWQNGAGDSFGSAHFLAASSGTILVPLDVPPHLPFGVEVEARAAGEPRGATTRLDVSLNGRSFGDVMLEIGVAKPTRRTFIAPAGAKLWRRGYNRVTISRPPDASPSTRFIVYALRAGAL